MPWVPGKRIMKKQFRENRTHIAYCRESADGRQRLHRQALRKGRGAAPLPRAHRWPRRPWSAAKVRPRDRAESKDGTQENEFRIQLLRPGVGSDKALKALEIKFLTDNNRFLEFSGLPGPLRMTEGRRGRGGYLGSERPDASAQADQPTPHGSTYTLQEPLRIQHCLWQHRLHHHGNTAGIPKTTIRPANLVLKCCRAPQ